jgi:HAD superfamily hydrolase (TIGR01549 family)
MQRLVLFDLDNTLVDRKYAFSLWARHFAAERGLDAAAERWLIETDGDGFGAKERFFAAVRERFALADTVESLWAQYRSRMPELVRCRPQVLHGLCLLREAGWRIGIVTNGMPDNQLAKIERTGLSEHVDANCVSGAVGMRKPDIRIFRLAAERCGADPDAGGWMVGDSPDLDIVGGRGAGLHTIWIGNQQPWPSGRPADHTVADATGAINLLLADTRETAARTQDDGHSR